MYEFMINHARAISEIKRESLLKALRNMSNLEIDWYMADLYDVEICTF
jgi:hypothetical protein